jgi:hypothetical protein
MCSIFSSALAVAPIATVDIAIAAQECSIFDKDQRTIKVSNA